MKWEEERVVSDDREGIVTYHWLKVNVNLMKIANNRSCALIKPLGTGKFRIVNYYPIFAGNEIENTTLEEAKRIAELIFASRLREVVSKIEKSIKQKQDGLHDWKLMLNQYNRFQGTKK